MGQEVTTAVPMLSPALRHALRPSQGAAVTSPPGAHLQELLHGFGGQRVGAEKGIGVRWEGAHREPLGVPQMSSVCPTSQQALDHPGSPRGGFPSSSPAEGLQEVLQPLHCLVCPLHLPVLVSSRVMM